MVLVSNFTCIHATQMSCLTVTSDVIVGTLCLLLSTVIVSRLCCAPAAKLWQQKPKRKKYLCLCSWAKTVSPHGTWQPNSHTDSPDPSILVGRPVRLSPNQPEWQTLRIRLYLFDCSRSMENNDLHCQSLTLPVEIVSALVTLSDRGRFSCLVCGCFCQEWNKF